MCVHVRVCVFPSEKVRSTCQEDENPVQLVGQATLHVWRMRERERLLLLCWFVLVLEVWSGGQDTGMEKR